MGARRGHRLPTGCCLLEKQHVLPNLPALSSASLIFLWCGRPVATIYLTSPLLVSFSQIKHAHMYTFHT